MSEEVQGKRKTVIDYFRSRGYEVVVCDEIILIRQRVDGLVADFDLGLFIGDEEFERMDKGALLYFANVITKYLYPPYVEPAYQLPRYAASLGTPEERLANAVFSIGKAVAGTLIPVFIEAGKVASTIAAAYEEALKSDVHVVNSTGYTMPGKTEQLIWPKPVNAWKLLAELIKDEEAK